MAVYNIIVTRRANGFGLRGAGVGIWNSGRWGSMLRSRISVKLGQSSRRSSSCVIDGDAGFAGGNLARRRRDDGGPKFSDRNAHSQVRRGVDTARGKSPRILWRTENCWPEVTLQSTWFPYTLPPSYLHVEGHERIALK